MAFVELNPDAELDVLCDHLEAEPIEVYRLLQSLQDEPRVCNRGRYRVRTFDGRLTTAQLKKLLQEAESGQAKDTSRAARLVKVLNALNARTPRGGVTVRELSVECGVGERQIYRDLKAVEQEMDIPLVKNGQPARYALKTTYLPPLRPDQALIIFLSLLQQKGSALSGHINTIKDILVAHLFKNRYRPEDFPVERLQQRLYFVEETLAHPDLVGQVLARITSALQEQVRLNIWYFVGYRGVLSERVIEPYALVCKRQHWFLVGYCTKSQAVRTFRVDQIENVVTRSNEHFDYPADFRIQDFVGEAWGVMNDGASQRVVLRFTPAVAYRLHRILYHPSQHIEQENADGSIVVSFRVSGLAEFKTWIVQWLDKVEVLEPETLRVQIRDIGAAISKLYEKE
ncbi:MAG: WYL domain-containing protein [Bacillota bacterium]|nr:WYL domain-containing protein [Bacillota bacterium]